MPARLRVVLAVAVAMVMAACATSKHSAEPAELTRFVSSARIEQVWSKVIGAGEPTKRLGLSLAVADDAVFVANHQGRVVAYKPHGTTNVQNGVSDQPVCCASKRGISG